MLAGQPAPTGPARRGAKPPVFPVAALDDPALPEALDELLAAQAEEMDADTVDPGICPSPARRSAGGRPGLDRKRSDDRHRAVVGPPDLTTALAGNQIATESAARADEVCWA